jgi:hypothetical protein
MAVPEDVYRIRNRRPFAVVEVHQHVVTEGKVVESTPVHAYFAPAFTRDQAGIPVEQ